ncbi:9761_t:CDS:2, partial [Funneliformis caledonium]
AYLSGKVTLVSIKTGGEKTLCYIICVLIFEGITIVIIPLKALIEDQKRELIPCASIYANTIQGRSEQEKIFEKIALSFTKILFITPEKLSKSKISNFISNMYNKAKVHIVIDEAHCILDYGCDDLFAILQPLLSDEQHRIIILYWKDGKIQIMIGTNAFDMGINSSDISSNTLHSFFKY